MKEFKMRIFGLLLIIFGNVYMYSLDRSNTQKEILGLSFSSQRKLALAGVIIGALLIAISFFGKKSD